MGWIQSKIPDVPITNFTGDWNDGRAVGALVDAVAPGTHQKKDFLFFFKGAQSLMSRPFFLSSLLIQNRFVSRLERLGPQGRSSKRH